MAKLKKANNISLVENVTQQIEEAIIDGEYKTGDKLPSTRELQTILEASLGTVRESLAILEQKGLLEVRKGAKGGFFVRKVSTEHMINSIETLMRHMVISHKELYEFRATVEAGMFRLFTQRASDNDINFFRNHLDKIRGCMNQGQAGWIKLIEIENDLRKKCLSVINNRTYFVVLTPIINNLQGYAQYHRFGGNQEIMEAVSFWEKIIPAIVERDEETVARMIKKMLYRFMALLENNPE